MIRLKKEGGIKSYKIFSETVYYDKISFPQDILSVDIKYESSKCLKLLKTIKRELMGELTKKRHRKPTANLPIYFDIRTGKGYARKDFKFSRKAKPYKVFRELYENMNELVSRISVLVLMKKCREDEGEQEEARTMNTYYITEMSKLLRKSTGLTPSELVQNSGALVLLGRKSKNT